MVWVGLLCLGLLLCCVLLVCVWVDGWYVVYVPSLNLGCRDVGYSYCGGLVFAVCRGGFGIPGVVFVWRVRVWIFLRVL